MSRIVGSGAGHGGKHSGKQPDTPPQEPAPQQNFCRFIDDGGSYEGALVDNIRRARREILVEVYILVRDGFGSRILDELEAACRRGVRVRFIIDGVGSHLILREEFAFLEGSPIEFRICHPLPWPFCGIERFSFDQLSRFSSFLSRANKRDHRKVFVFDGERAVLGSHNLWDESLQWSEASLLFDGEAVDEVARSFEMVWVRSHDLSARRGPRINILDRFRVRPFAKHTEVLTNTSLRRRNFRYRIIYQSLRQARGRIWLTTPYLYPQSSFTRLLARKAREGLDVRLLVPRKSDVPLENWLSQALYHHFLRAGVAIYELGEPILHAKILLIDRRVLIGSSNFNHRSFLRDLEIDYYSGAPELVAEVEAWKRRHLAAANRISSLEQVRRLFLKKCLYRLLTPVRTWF